MLIKNCSKHVYLLSVLLLTAAAFFSCGVKEDKSLQTEKNASINPSDSIQFKTVRLKTQWLHQAQFAGFYVAQKRGFYSDYGIKVIIEMGGPDDPSSTALTDKKADIVSMFLSKALREIDNGNQIVNLAQISQKSSFLLVAKKNSGIRQIQDINNRKIGIWSNDFREPSMIFLNKQKISAQIVPVSWTTNVLAFDVVDIMNMMVYNEYDIFVNTGYDPDELTVFPLAEYGVNIPEDGIYCLREYYEKNQELCHDFAEATMQGWIYALNHEEETLSLVLDYLKQNHLPANIPHQRWMLQKIHDSVLYNMDHFGKLSETDYEASVEMMTSNNIIKNHIPYMEFVGYADSE
ncbi:MAG: ABC transporter substrate-binding protein [Clostridia bacterium]|nr:ABC transporter substrate-binding protein [Clostridia bacterium]